MSIDHKLASGIANHRIRALKASAMQVREAISNQIYTFILRQFNPSRKIKPLDFNRTLIDFAKRVGGNDSVTHLETIPMTPRNDGLLRLRFAFPTNDRCMRNGGTDAVFTDTNLHCHCMTLEVSQKSIRVRNWSPPTILDGHYFDRYVQRIAGADFNVRDAAQITDTAAVAGVAILRAAILGHLKPGFPIPIPQRGGVAIGSFTYQADPFHDQDVTIDRTGSTHRDELRDQPQRLAFSMHTYVDEPKLATNQTNSTEAIAFAFADLLSGDWITNQELLYGCPYPGSETDAAFNDMIHDLRLFGEILNKESEFRPFKVKKVLADLAQNPWASAVHARQSFDQSLRQLMPKKIVETLESTCEITGDRILNRSAVFHAPTSANLPAGMIRDVIFNKPSV